MNTVKGPPFSREPRVPSSGRLPPAARCWAGLALPGAGNALARDIYRAARAGPGAAREQATWRRGESSHMRVRCSRTPAPFARYIRTGAFCSALHAREPGGGGATARAGRGPIWRSPRRTACGPSVPAAAASIARRCEPRPLYRSHHGRKARRRVGQAPRRAGGERASAAAGGARADGPPGCVAAPELNPISSRGRASQRVDH